MGVCKVMIVEDELISRQAVKYVLGMDSANFEIIGEAYNGEEGLQMLERLHPHILISDVVMPLMDGIEFVKSVKLRYPHIYTVILSGHSDFNYVKSAFQNGASDYILKSEMEPGVLLGKLYGVMRKLTLPVRDNPGKPDRFGWLTGLLAGEEGALPPHNLRGEFFMLVCRLGCVADRELNSLENAVNTILAQAYTAFGEENCFYTVTGQDILVFLLPGASYNSACCEFVEQVTEKIPALFFVRSRKFTDLKQTHQIFENARVLMELSFYHRDKKMICETSVARLDTHTGFNMNSYLDKMKLCRYETAFAQLNNFVASLGDEKYLSETELKKLLDNVIYNTIDVLLEGSTEPEKLYTLRMSFFPRIEQAVCSDELVQTMRDVTREILEYLKAGEVGENNFHMRIARYIQENYRNQITLQDIARHFHISYNYLSGSFNSMFGCGFSEHLNSVRLKAAMELLAGTELPVSEISEVIGYSDQGYFGKVFKKKTGLKPMEYRKRNQGGKP
ncbi:response regulator [Hydrogenoanaerobacterium sp.]|uniref:response regulator transcription factor n=1 Tax=Hydrogenoanaerobacterium sp. TaxID=2953763 RepID=UPI00289C1687|nr:response regulator [Hydrogenoanaerobacterium sp.]